MKRRANVCINTEEGVAMCKETNNIEKAREIYNRILNS